jgi:hypothetical protein
MSDTELSINFRDIDYSGIKEGLITFLRSTQTFKDANFEGTFLSQLVNMFSYTGAIFGNYINAMASEQYIKTCNLYETANMLGNNIGYKPHGFRGSRTSITVNPDFDAMGIDETHLSNYYGWSAIFPRNTRFTTTRTNAKNKSLIFSNTTDAILTLKNPALDPLGNANVISLELVQGIPMMVEFTSDGKSLQSFEIPNPFIDFKEVSVYVLNDSNKEEKWESALTWFYADSDSKIYIPYINQKGLLEILFGDGNFGQIPEAGKTIRIEYVVTTGAAGNVDAGMINSLVDNIYFVSDDFTNNIRGQFIVTQPSASSEGLNIETMDRIKKFAPLYFGIQNRLVNHFDYKWFILGEYNFLTDAAAFNYEEAVAAGLLQSPCQNELTNARWQEYNVVESSDGNTRRIPLYWDIQGFYDAYTVIPDDTLPLPPVDGEAPKVRDLLNSGTETGLYIDTSKPCNDNQGALLNQYITIKANDDCCTYISFEVEIKNPEFNVEAGEYPEITKDDILLYVNGEQCFTRIDKFTYNSSGYIQKECCCNRGGDAGGWYTAKGVAILDNSLVNTDTGEAKILASIAFKPNKILLLGEAKLYPQSCLTANDIFIVPVPVVGGYLNIETRKNMLVDLDEIKMINVRNHIIAPIYQIFDVRVVFKKDETSIITLEEVTNSIRAKVVELFLPTNRTLGDKINTADLAMEISTLPGVARSKVTLYPRTEYLQQQALDSELGDFQLRPGDFPILGEIQLG